LATPALLVRAHRHLVLLKVLFNLFTQQHLAARFARGTTVISSQQPAQGKQSQEFSGRTNRRRRL
jgi:hypothetical protein